MEISTKTLHFIEEHREDDTRTLALQSKKYPDVDTVSYTHLTLPTICSV